MAFEEKGAWGMLVVTVGAVAIYAAVILGRAGPTPLADVTYVPAMLWTIGGSIVAAILLRIGAAIATPGDADKMDQRDREINRFGDYVGQSFVVIGGLLALVLSMAEVDHFWIANAIYVTFALSSVLGSVTKIVAYRRGFQQW